MLVYAIILVASLIVAIIIQYAYSIISEARRSASSSNEPIVSIRHFPRHKRNKTTRSDILNPALEAGQTMGWNAAKTQPAAPSDRDDWYWKGTKPTVHSQQPGHGTGVFNNSRPSSHGTASARSTVNPEWPHRQDKNDSNGTAYKVTR